jgi:hypothetical protein
MALMVSCTQMSRCFSMHVLLVPMMSAVTQDNYDPSMHGFGTENYH